MADEPPVPTIADFEWGTQSTPAVTEQMPSPDDYVEYTAWHVKRALDQHRESRENEKKKKGRKVGPVFPAFPVSLPQRVSRRLTDIQQELKVVRTIQPRDCFTNGKIKRVHIGLPKHSRQQMSILLYVLLEGGDNQECSACRRHNATGPFQTCVNGGKWTDYACLCCNWSGTSHKCSFRLST